MHKQGHFFFFFFTKIFQGFISFPKSFSSILWYSNGLFWSTYLVITPGFSLLHSLAGVAFPDSHLLMASCVWFDQFANDAFTHFAKSLYFPTFAISLHFYIYAIQKQLKKSITFSSHGNCLKRGGMAEQVWNRKVVCSFSEYFCATMTFLSFCNLLTKTWIVNIHITRTMGKHSAKYLDKEKQIGFTQCLTDC